MTHVTDNPFLLFVLSFICMSLFGKIGMLLRKRHRLTESEALESFDVVRNASLTLLALIIGFTFSMAVSRYDQRKNFEEAEANAIGTEFVRADLLPDADKAKVRTLLQSYLGQRILSYTIRNKQQLRQIDADTVKLQAALWSAVHDSALAKPTPVSALVVAGMNDVLNSQGYTQAAWWNRIPVAAWMLLTAIAICCSALVGYGAKFAMEKNRYIWILPLVVSIAILLIADIDSPRQGVIRVVPQNLLSLAESLHTY